MSQPTIFISYNRKDEKEKEQLLAHLSVLQHAGLINVWSDDRIQAGSSWQQEIEQTIDQASIAILLISAHFLTSDFILGQELPKLLARRQDGGLIVLPVIAKACAWQRIDWLAKLWIRPKNCKPIWGDGGGHIDEALAAIVEEVADILKFKPPSSNYRYIAPSRKPSLKDFRQWLLRVTV
jgi:hypothetical protein